VAYDEGIDDGGWTEAESLRSVENKREYARRHGYDVQVGHFSELTSRPGGWGKIIMIQKALETYDFVFYIDVDTVVMNHSIKVEQMLPRNKDIAMTEDSSGVNSGAMVIRQSAWSKWFLEEVWRQEWLVHGDYPFHWDQRPFHYLLQTKKWVHQFGNRIPYPIEDAKLCKKIHCPEVDNADPRRRSEDIMNHIQALPQCAMNSFLLWPFSQKNQKRLEKSQYIPGDFILHAAGYRGLMKSAVFRAGMLRVESTGEGAALRGAESSTTGQVYVIPLLLLLLCTLAGFYAFWRRFDQRNRERGSDRGRRR